MLFYAILYSDSIVGLNPTVRGAIEELRQFRNQRFAHVPTGKLSRHDFQTSIQKLFQSFRCLGISFDEIQNLAAKTCFSQVGVRSNQQDHLVHIHQPLKPEVSVNTKLDQNIQLS